MVKSSPQLLFREVGRSQKNATLYYYIPISPLSFTFIIYLYPLFMMFYLQRNHFEKVRRSWYRYKLALNLSTDFNTLIRFIDTVLNYSTARG